MSDGHHSSRIPIKVLETVAEISGDTVESVQHSFSLQPQTSIRVNARKLSNTLQLEAVDWCTNGFYLPERPVFALDPLFHAGAYYVQESSSMFLEEVLKQHVPTDEPLAVLDLCGAPGGKSTHLHDILNDQSFIVSNEVVRKRASVLYENLSKWGNTNQAVTSNDPAEIGKSKLRFDLIVVDAPCSGEGLFRRDIEAVEQWSEANVELCSARQKRILADIWPALKPGGWLVYSTCTFNKLENEDNLKWLVENFEAESLPLAVKAEDVLETREHGCFGYRFLPNRSKGEGFFVSIFQKSGNREQSDLASAPRKAGGQKLSVPVNLMCPSSETTLIEFRDSLCAIPSAWRKFIHELDALRPVSLGTEIGNWKGKQFRPSQPLANSFLLSRDFPRLMLSHEDALDFLSRKEIKRLEPKGWHAVQFDTIDLGFVNSIGNRLNNNFQKEWRLRLDWTQRRDDLFSIQAFYK